MLCRLYRTVWSVGFFSISFEVSMLFHSCTFSISPLCDHVTLTFDLLTWNNITSYSCYEQPRTKLFFLFVRSDGIHRWRTIGWHWTVTFFRMFIAYGTQRSPCFHYVLCAALGQILWHISVWALCSLWLKTDLQFTRDTDNLFVCRTANLSPGSEVNISLYVCVDKFIHHKMLVKKSNRNTGPVL